jgi:UDP-N-acetylmuramoyl-L-alanyl-D-glutamate--2,6-diaminopimelate ligase
MKTVSRSLEELITGLQVSGATSNPQIDNISLDSREIRPGGLFVALKGEKVDARDLILEAMQQDAVAVLVDKGDEPALAGKLSGLTNVLQLENLRTELSRIGARFYAKPSDKLKVVGITGTNGKTTIAWYLAQMLEILGVSTGVMGTLGAGPVNALESTGLTTPDALRVQKRLAEMVHAGLDVVCMEISSHGLTLGRVNKVEFDTVVYTNLSQDHLDFHRTMEAYAGVKKSLFSEYEYRHSVVNSDDSLGLEIADYIGEDCLSYGIDRGRMRAQDIRLRPRGLQFTVSHEGEEAVLSTALIGKFNVYNLLAVLGVARKMGYSLVESAAALAKCHAVPGRMERIDTQTGDPVVVVDYAHTPDALDKALLACREHCGGKLSLVFGCGGDRDREKRPEMGRIAERHADEIFITDDNPRSEQPGAIVADIQRGLSSAVWVLHDRALAIRAALTQACAEDWVLIAGKGHETTQSYADRIVDFDDRVSARQTLSRRAA